MTHRFNAGQHANISSKVGRLEESLVFSLEVEVNHKRLQLVTNDP